MLESAELAAASMWRAVVQKKLEQVSVGVRSSLLRLKLRCFAWCKFSDTTGRPLKSYNTVLREILDDGRTDHMCSHRCSSADAVASMLMLKRFYGLR